MSNKKELQMENAEIGDHFQGWEVYSTLSLRIYIVI
jgi:hypothetical protein